MRRILLALVLLVCGASTARAQVVFGAAGSTDCLSGAGVSSLTCATLTVGAGTNRALICAPVFSVVPTGPTVSWDILGANQSMTAITGASGANTSQVMLFGLVAPVTGAKTVSVAWTSPTLQASIVCLAYTGVNQTGGVTTFAHGTSATGSGLTNSVTVTSATNNAVVAVHTQITNTFTAINSTGFGGSSANSGIDNNGTTYDAAWNRAVGAATVTMTATNQNTATWASAGTDVVSAGGAAVPTRTLLGVGTEIH